MRTVVGRMGSGRRSALVWAMGYQRRPAVRVSPIARMGPMTVAMRQMRVARSVRMGWDVLRWWRCLSASVDASPQGEGSGD